MIWLRAIEIFNRQGDDEVLDKVICIPIKSGGLGSKFSDIWRQTSLPPASEKRVRLLGGGRVRLAGWQLRTGIILRLIRQCRPRPGPVRIPSDAKTFPPSAKTLGFLPTATVAAATLVELPPVAAAPSKPKSAATARLLLSAFQSLAIIGLLCWR